MNFSLTMKKMLQRLTGLTAGGFLALTTAWGQSDYATPYTFVTIAGTAGNNAAADGTNSSALFYWPEGITVGTNGNLYVVDNFENTVRQVAPAGTNWVVTTIAGTAGDSGGGDGTNQAAQFYEPTSIAIDGRGSLYVADGGNNIIRMITPAGTNWVVSTIAGTAGSGGGNDGTNGGAQFNYPSGITVDTNGSLYVADLYNDTIRKVAPVGTNWVVTTIAGSASNPGSNDGTNGAARFYEPSGIAIDRAGNLFVTDTYYSIIRKLMPAGTNWVVSTIAGTASLNGGSADGTNGDAQFNTPYGITVDAGDNLYVADTYNNTIRKVAPAGTNWVTTTLAGVADGGSGGSTDGTGAGALFSIPYCIAVDGVGDLFVGDTVNGTIREGQVAAGTNAPAPDLTIGLTALNSVVVSWSNVGGYTLQTNGNLATPNWAGYGGAVTTSGGTSSIVLPPPAGKLFFRLTK